MEKGEALMGSDTCNTTLASPCLLSKFITLIHVNWTLATAVC
jgi:hypothetical protein